MLKINMDEPDTWSVLPVTQHPVCLKSVERRSGDLLKKAMPKLIKYCQSNAQKMLTHSLAGTVLLAVLNKTQDEALMKSIIECSLHDREGRVLDDLPKEAPMEDHSRLTLGQTEVCK